MADVEVPIEAAETGKVDDVSAKKNNTITESPEQPRESMRASTFGNEQHFDRDRWPSRVAFYMAAVGSAVGFGNGT